LREQTVVRAQPDALVWHDLLGEHTDACWFHELGARLPGRGLAWLGDADPTTMLPIGHPPAALAALARMTSDPIDREQALDFLTGRAARMTLVCRADEPIDRSLRAERVRSLHVSSRATPGASGPAEAVYHTPGGVSARVAAPATRAALDALAAAWPASVPFAALAAAATDADRLGAAVLELFLAGVVELSLRPAALTAAPGARPTATAYARWQAARGGPVASRRHEVVTLDATQAGVLARCDGSRDRAGLAAELELPVAVVAAEIERLAYGGLLIA
jgi:hypothetical protein